MKVAQKEERGCRGELSTLFSASWSEYGVLVRSGDLGQEWGRSDDVFGKRIGIQKYEFARVCAERVFKIAKDIAQDGFEEWIEEIKKNRFAGEDELASVSAD